MFTALSTHQMTRYMFTTLSILLLFALAPTSVAELRCDCERAQCEEPVGCRAGITYDMCGCCKICSKPEGGVCGGVNHVEGECGKGLQCMVRDVRNRVNRLKLSVSELVGRCEYYPCHRMRCPLGQSCSVYQGRPVCGCPRCEEMVTEPVCGEADGVLYANECELRKRECLHKERINLAPTPCIDVTSISVVCHQTQMHIAFKKTFLRRHPRGEKLVLWDPQCGLQENSTHYFSTFNLTACGTRIQHTLTTVVYSNVVRTLANPNSIIIRFKNLQLPFECDYSLYSRDWQRNGYEHSKDYRQLTKWHNKPGHSRLPVRENLRRNGEGVRIRRISPVQSFVIVNNRSQHAHSSPSNSTHRYLAVDINAEEQYFVELRSRTVQFATGVDRLGMARTPIGRTPNLPVKNHLYKPQSSSTASESAKVDYNIKDEPIKDENNTKNKLTKDEVIPSSSRQTQSGPTVTDNTNSVGAENSVGKISNSIDKGTDANSIHGGADKKSSGTDVNVNSETGSLSNTPSSDVNSIGESSNSNSDKISSNSYSDINSNSDKMISNSYSDINSNVLISRKSDSKIDRNSKSRHANSNTIGDSIKNINSSSTTDSNSVNLPHDSVNMPHDILAEMQSARLVPTFCYASPISHLERWMKYAILENGCPTEPGVEVLKSETPMLIRLSVPGIVFRRSKKPGFLVRCKVRACLQDSTDAVCSPQCKKRSTRRRRSSVHESRDLYKLKRLMLTGRPIMVPKQHSRHPHHPRHRHRSRLHMFKSSLLRK